MYSESDEPYINRANYTADQRVLRGWCDKRAKDGVAPELNPGWVRRRKNTYPEVRYATYKLLKADGQAPASDYGMQVKNRRKKIPIPKYAMPRTSY